MESSFFEQDFSETPRIRNWVAQTDALNTKSTPGQLEDMKVFTHHVQDLRTQLADAQLLMDKKVVELNEQLNQIKDLLLMSSEIKNSPVPYRFFMTDSFCDF
jgi:hypothetical protein